MHEIPVTSPIPIRVKPFRHPPVVKEEINRQVAELLKNEIIEPSVSAYSAPVFCRDKKPDSAGNKRVRMVIDYRQLNKFPFVMEYLEFILQRQPLLKYIRAKEWPESARALVLDPEAYKILEVFCSVALALKAQFSGVLLPSLLPDPQAD